MSGGHGQEPIWDDVKALFLEASALPTSERSSFLDRQCGARADLRREIESLLESDADAPPFVHRPEAALGLAVSSAAEQIVSAREAGHPESIGGCRVLSLIGEGTFGFVYLAEQSSPRRRVAVKVLKPGIVSPMALRRLEREADIMARLQHPGIAQVIEAGVEPGPSPRPYFVMEYIEGTPVSDYVTAHHLTTSDRLKLFIAVCEAVQHAHGNGVIHRDLKPSNILVTKDGHPKVLDFGVARSLDPDARQATLATSVGQLIGTLAYMSPEQAAGDADHVDARADVYGLGAVLYELLSGRVPLEVSDKPLTEALRIIQSVTPSRLGTLSRQLRGDVETIVAKALQKDAGQRYATVAEFGADVRRHLEHQTILARRPGPIYEFTKFAARHRALVAGAALAITGIVGGGVAAGVWALKAQEQTRATESVAFVLTDALDAVDAASGGAEFGALDSLVASLDQVMPDIASKPALAARVQGEVGRLLATYGHSAAVGVLRRAREATILASGADSVEAASASCALAAALVTAEKYREAEDLLYPAVGALLEGEGRVWPDGVEGLVTLSAALCEKPDLHQARLAAARAAMLADGLSERREEIRALAAAQVAVVDYLANPKTASALVPRLRAASDDLTAAIGRTHPKAINVQQALAFILGAAGKTDESIQLFERSLANAEARFGPNNAAVADQRKNLALGYYNAGRFADAEPIIRGTVKILRLARGDRDVTLGDALFDLGMAVYQQGKKDELEALFSESLSIFDGAPPDGRYGPDGWRTLQAKENLGNVYVNEINRPADGDRVYAEVMASFEKLGQTGGSRYITAAANRAAARTNLAPPKYDDETERCGRLAFEWHSARESKLLNHVAWNYHRVLMGRGKFAEAASMWNTVLSRDGAGVAARRHLAEALIRLGRLDEAHAELLLAGDRQEANIDSGYEGLIQVARGNSEAAERLLRQALSTHQHRGFELSLFRSALGECLTKQGRYEEAQNELVRAHEDLKRQVGPCWMTDEADLRLNALYSAWGKDRAVEEPPVRARIQAERDASVRSKPGG